MALEIVKTYYIKNVATGKYLNVYGTDTVANSRNVNTYAKENCLAQKRTLSSIQQLMKHLLLTFTKMTVQCILQPAMIWTLF